MPTPQEALRAAKAQVAAQQAEADKLAALARQLHAQRDSLTNDGIKALAELRTRLLSVLEDAPRSKSTSDTYSCGGATIRIDKPQKLAGDVLTWARIELRCVCSPSGREYRRSASLIFAEYDGPYRWQEVAFFQPFGRGPRDAPLSLEPVSFDFQAALSPAMHTYQLAYGPVAIDGDGEQPFFDRWTGWFAKAMVGELDRPSMLPMALGSDQH